MKPETIRVRQRGFELLRSPALNKGSAFTLEERRALGLNGLLPPYISTLEQQIVRVIENVRARANPLDRYIYLRSLQDRNQTLFHAAVIEHLEELAPIIYTPTVGEAVRRFSHIFRTSRGLYLTPENIGSIDEMLTGAPEGEVAVIVCTDSEGILGIGDQGVGGIGIPIGKLALYVAVGGFHPSNCLPICLDVGTDNEELLSDPLYLGMRRRRLGDEEYAEFIEAFVQGVRRNCPRAVLQWEDFSRDRAFDNLERYRDLLPSFNDDIQGTAAVVHAGLLGALKLAGRPLAEETICVLGAGAAGVGVANGLIAALVAEGLSAEEANAAVYVMDTKGLIVSDRPHLPAYKRRIATEPEVVRAWDASPEQTSLREVIENARPGVLIALSGQPGAIPREIVAEMGSYCERPIIFPLSNPSGRVDAHPHDIVRWSEGRAIVAVGSPFEPMEYERCTHRFSQVNNFYVFPGIGAGAHLSGARRIADAIFVAAADAVHRALDDEDLAQGLVLPPAAELRPVAAQVAAAVMRAAYQEHEHTLELPADPEAHASAWQYVPRYYRYQPA